MPSLLTDAFIYLFAAVVAVPLSRRLGLGSVLGYLLAGIVIGPALGLVGGETQNIQHVAEFGVVMMLFLVGLELEPRKLWQMRSRLLGLGGLQVALATVVIAAAGIALGQRWQVAVAAGCVLSLSSTAIVLQTLGEGGQLDSPGGQSSFAVLLFQDIAAIPMLALLPFLAMPDLAAQVSGDAAHSAGSLLDGLNGYLKAGITLAVIAGIVIGGHYLSRPVFQFIAASRLREVFTLFALTLVVGIAALMSTIGLSPALGTFLAGVVLADSEYRHELESDLEPFKGLLLGLFFITVGAGIDFHLLATDFGTIVALTLAMLVIKGAILWLLGRLFGLHDLDRKLFALALAQAGEFGFVLLSFCVQNAIMPAATADRLLLVVALSMLLTPLLFIVYNRVIVPRSIASETRPDDTIDDPHPVLVIGNGRFGQMINGMLLACDYRITVVDFDADLVGAMRRYGLKTYFGDASRPELLATAGLAQARLLVVAIDQREQALSIVEHARRIRPDLPIICRAIDRPHVYDLHDAGANEIVRETFDSAIRTGRLALEILGMPKDQAARISQFYSARDRHSVWRMAEAYDPALPRYSNTAMADIGRQVDRETNEMIRALLRGEDVDWTPPENTASSQDAVASAATATAPPAANGR